jgi:hypothetical protein
VNEIKMFLITSYIWISNILCFLVVIPITSFKILWDNRPYILREIKTVVKMGDDFKKDLENKWI